MWDNSRAHHAFTVERRFPELTVNDRDVAGLRERSWSLQSIIALPPRGKAPSHDALDVFTPILLVAVAAYVPRTSLASAQKSLGVALPDRLLARRGD